VPVAETPASDAQLCIIAVCGVFLAGGAYRIGGPYYDGVWYGTGRRWYVSRWWPARCRLKDSDRDEIPRLDIRGQGDMKNGDHDIEEGQASRDPAPQNRIDALEGGLKRLTRGLQEAETRILELERRSMRGWLAEQFGARLHRHVHYRPRPLRVPDWYLAAKAPAPAPRIAIVTPSLNQGNFIASTIESVISQGYPNLAYHVQDGGSTDHTEDTLKQFGSAMSWEIARDLGQAHAINRGFAQVRGDVMAYLNSDDTLVPGTLAYVASFFAAHPEIDIVYGHRIIIDNNGDEVGRWVLPPHDDDVLKWADFVPQETLFWRSRVWDKLGGFDETFQYALDWEFLLRVQHHGFRFARLPRFLGCFRVHNDQKTSFMGEVGARESALLRERYIGRKVKPEDIDRAIRPYLRRHVLFHRLYKFPLLNY
jgi:glycosyltransferase involved in cell wall biosynthesis